MQACRLRTLGPCIEPTVAQGGLRQWSELETLMRTCFTGRRAEGGGVTPFFLQPACYRSGDQLVHPGSGKEVKSEVGSSFGHEWKSWNRLQWRSDVGIGKVC